MKKVIGVGLALAIGLSFSQAAMAEKTKLKGKDASMHQIILSTKPADVEIVGPYQHSIKLYQLKTDELAYWVPEGGKYIVDGNYAYLWCRVYKKNDAKSKYHWLAIANSALNKALKVGHEYQGGVAFYQLTYDGKMLHFKAYLYSTLHAIAAGEKVIDMRE
ncbi:MAG: hypothetical protein ABH859_06085 [Pseudomonadota bacterium]